MRTDEDFLLDDSDSADEQELSRPTQEMLKLIGGACLDCATSFSPLEALWSIVLGFKTTPRCLACLALGLGRDPQELLVQLHTYVQKRECYLRAYREAERLGSTPRSANGSTSPCVAQPDTKPVKNISLAESSIDMDASFWDAGELACGELVLELRLRLQALPAGGALQLRATDPAAPEDLPAWCRLTRHELVQEQHPFYTVRKPGV